jgi:hypothetical protein
VNDRSTEAPLFTAVTFHPLKKTNTSIMEESSKPSSRKKFLLLTGAAFLSASVLRMFTRKKKEKEPTVKLLTQDGKLVEIDRSRLPTAGKKISDKELQQWIRNNTSNEQKIHI